MNVDITLFLLFLLFAVVSATTPSMGHDQGSNEISKVRSHRYRSHFEDMLLADPPVSRDDSESKPHTERPVRKLHGSSAVKRLPKKRSRSGEEVRLSTASVRKVMLDVIAERDAQMMDALTDMNRTEAHLKSIVEMIEESNQISQNIASIMIKLDEGLRRLDTKVVMMGEKLSQLEARQAQLDRRIEREAASLAGRIEEVLRKSNKIEDGPSSESLLLDIRELLSDMSSSMDRLSNEGLVGNEINNSISPIASGIAKPVIEASLETRLVSVIQATHGDIIKVVREVESNVDNQLAMVTGDTAYIHCGVGKLLERQLAKEDKEDSEESNDIPQMDDTKCSRLTNGSTAHLCP